MGTGPGNSEGSRPPLRLFVPAAAHEHEPRAAAVPETVRRLSDLGLEVTVEASLGTAIGIADKAYEDAGAVVLSDRGAGLAAADVVVRLRPPPVDEVGMLKAGCLHVSYLDPFNRHDLLEALAAAQVSAVSMEMVPRTTIAQKMDALSSQASLAGYEAVIMAAARLPKIFPMMMTPAGTIAPARVFVIGAGVAGLQAIATAKRLGARVHAFDTRPVVREQVESLGGRFVEVDLGATGQTKDGYAKALSEDQLRLQREAMARECAQADVVITTAQIFGRRAPLIVTDQMLAGMRAGCVVIDLAVETGGNVEGSEPDREVIVHGVRVVGLTNVPGRVPRDASLMYASNVANLIEHIWNADSGRFDLEDETVAACLVCHRGEIVHDRFRPSGEKE